MSTGDGEYSNEGRGKRKTEELFVEYYDFMFATARKVLKQKADAEDVVRRNPRKWRTTTSPSWSSASRQKVNAC